MQTGLMISKAARLYCRMKRRTCAVEGCASELEAPVYVHAVRKQKWHNAITKDNMAISMCSTNPTFWPVKMPSDHAHSMRQDRSTLRRAASTPGHRFCNSSRIPCSSVAGEVGTLTARFACIVEGAMCRPEMGIDRYCTSQHFNTSCSGDW
jgi:hypothetical protein